MELEPPGIIPPDDDPVLGRDPVVAAVEDAVDAGRLEEAVDEARRALGAGEGNRLDLLFVLGDALLELGQPAEAEAAFRSVLVEDQGCPSSRCWLAMALYRQRRFDEALHECDEALRSPTPAVDAHVVRGLLLERSGDYQAADACFMQAHERDPQRFSLPVRMSREDFDREVQRAARALPRQFRKHLQRLPVVVEDLPSDALLASAADLDPDLLGLFDGVPLAESGASAPAELRPSYIYLFQRNLERAVRSENELVEQVRVTLYHELAHFLGFEEEDMDAMGLE
jgi:predicted Zn-dependent protease with MMP-like domain